MSTENINRFQKNDLKRAAQRNANHGVSRAEAIDIRDRKRAEWTGHGLPEKQSRNGALLLDARTLAAKDAALAERKSTNPAPAQQMSAATLESITRDWLSRNPGFYNRQSRWNLRPAVRLRQYRTKPRKVEEGAETGWRASRYSG